MTAVYKKQLAFFVLAALIVGLGMGFGLGYASHPKSTAVSQTIRENSDKYKFIHPLLALARPDISTPTPSYAKLARDVDSFLSEQKRKAYINSASVYFIDYGENGSFAINEKEAYDPASMLKVVIMVAFLKKSETDPSILNQKVPFTTTTQKLLESIPFEDPTKLVVGTTYSVSDLIHSMIADSDNGATNLLLPRIDGEYLDQVYEGLGLAKPQSGVPYKISANDYSLFFRVLYNATYLSRDNSEEALSLLAQAAYKDGLVAGLPSGTTVAHKFGEYVKGTKDQVEFVELHDCGIIFPDRGPYLLCVMTKGKNFDTLKSVISGISKMVYQNVTS